MNIRDKTLKEIRDELRLTMGEIADALGIDRTTYSRYEAKNSFPDKKKSDFYYSILEDFFKDKYGIVDNPDIQQVPLYDDIEATASVLEIFSDNNTIQPSDYIKIPNLPKCDGAMPIRGDSMYPLLKSGDIVLYKILNDKSSIVWGEMYIVYINNNGDEFLLTKYLHPSTKVGYITCVSQNAHHAPVEFPLDSVLSIAHIKASVRINTKI